MRKNLQRLQASNLQVIVNVQILTEGTNLPIKQTIFLVRPTTSTILMTQMVNPIETMYYDETVTDDEIELNYISYQIMVCNSTKDAFDKLKRILSTLSNIKEIWDKAIKIFGLCCFLTNIIFTE